METLHMTKDKKTLANSFKPKWACEFSFTDRRRIVDDYRLSSYYIEANAKKFRSTPSWIKTKIHSDGGVWEVPTPVCKTHEIVAKRWRELDALVKRLGAKYHDIDGDSGGGHIHVCMPPNSLGEEFRVRFIKNLLIEVSNNPWIIWAFNSSVDNVNARLPINVYETIPSDHYREAFMTIKKWGDLSAYIRKECIFLNTNNNTIKERAQLKWMRYNAITKFAKKHRYEGVFGIHNGHRISYFDLIMEGAKSTLSKSCAINWCTYQNTVEFRFFDVPTSERQLLLHLKVAQTLYERAMLNTINGKQPKVDETTLKTVEISKGRSVKELVRWCEEAGIDRSEIKGQLASLTKRYSVEEKYNGVFLKDYLL